MSGSALASSQASRELVTYSWTMVVSVRIFPTKPIICLFFLKNSATECSLNSFARSSAVAPTFASGFASFAGAGEASASSSTIASSASFFAAFSFAIQSQLELLNPYFLAQAVEHRFVGGAFEQHEDGVLGALDFLCPADEGNGFPVNGNECPGFFLDFAAGLPRRPDDPAFLVPLRLRRLADQIRQLEDFHVIIVLEEQERVLGAEAAGNGFRQAQGLVGPEAVVLRGYLRFPCLPVNRSFP